MTPELKEYYKSIQKWIDSGCPDKSPYYIGVGLCNNIKVYAGTYSKHISLVSEMKAQFILADLDIAYPFNESSFDYHTEQQKYTNQARLDWVKLHSQ